MQELTKIAARKGITPAQLCLAWVRYLGQSLSSLDGIGPAGARGLTVSLTICDITTGSHVIPIPGSSHKSRVLENLASVDVTLSGDELDEIRNILSKHQVQGDRYYGAEVNALTWG